MRQIILTFHVLLVALLANAQNPIAIPDTLSGNTIDLYIANSSKQFFAGYNSSTIGYNGSYLGPTIILTKGQVVTMNVHNQLNDTTTTHWHGLHVAPVNDGSPHNPILSGSTWSPSFEVKDNAATYWYHPHLHGKTFRQVLKGAAGLIIVKDDIESGLNLPRTYGVDDVPLVFQWQTIDPVTKQIVFNDELDNVTMVNGTINGYVNLPAQVVRLRLLNASSQRFFEFGFSDNRTFNQITSDDGLLNTPVPMTRLMLGSGERAEILVDFSGQNGQTFFIKQYGTQLPAGYPGGPTSGMGGVLGPLDNTIFNLLQINVTAQTSAAVTTIPSALTTNFIYPQSGAANFNLLITASPMMSMTNFLMNGVKFDENVINMTTELNKTMIWTITNQSMMPHPFHIHGNHFYVLTINGISPPLNQRGRKDVVVIPPNGGIVRLVTKYNDYSDSSMPYMFHCHILSHEDNGMMGQFIVNPVYTGLADIMNNNNIISVFPNPNSGIFSVSTGTEETSEIRISDCMGKIIYQNFNVSSGSIVDLQDYPAGLYFIKVKTVSREFFNKLIIR